MKNMNLFAVGTAGTARTLRAADWPAHAAAHAHATAQTAAPRKRRNAATAATVDGGTI
jgi:hypothetical protein